MFPQHGLDIIQRQRATEVDGDITDLAQDKRCESGAAAIVVFTEHLIPHPVGTLDLPAATSPLQQLLGIRLLPSRHDGVRHTS